MMITNRLETLQCAIALVGPGLALVGFQVWTQSSGPATASASTPMIEPVPSVTRIESRPVTATQRAVSVRVAEIDLASAPDPFLRQSPNFSGMADLPADQSPEQAEPTAEPIPALVVSAVVAGRQPIAVIEGQPRKVGDRLGGTGWKLVEITTQGIVIEHADGRRATININRSRP